LKSRFIGLFHKKKGAEVQQSAQDHSQETNLKGKLLGKFLASTPEKKEKSEDIVEGDYVGKVYKQQVFDGQFSPESSQDENSDSPGSNSGSSYGLEEFAPVEPLPKELFKP